MPSLPLQCRQIYSWIEISEKHENKTWWNTWYCDTQQLGFNLQFWFQTDFPGLCRVDVRFGHQLREVLLWLGPPCDTSPARSSLPRWNSDKAYSAAIGACVHGAKASTLQTLGLQDSWKVWAPRVSATPFSGKMGLGFTIARALQAWDCICGRGG